MRMQIDAAEFSCSPKSQHIPPTETGRKRNMPFQGYVRFPTIHQDSIVFVAEDDLWLVESAGGRAERLTAGVAEVQTPVFSPDGRQLAFVGKAEGAEEVYLMPGLGDETTRLT